MTKQEPTLKQLFTNLPRYWQDVLERAGWTFVQGYGAAWGVASLPALIPTYEKLFTAVNWKTGVAAAALSIIKSVSLKNVGNKNSASILRKK